MKERTIDLLMKQFGVIEYCEGRTGNGKSKSRKAVRLVFDRELAEENVDYILGLKNVVGVGTCTYRYAPEIRCTYCIAAER